MGLECKWIEWRIVRMVKNFESAAAKADKPVYELTMSSFGSGVDRSLRVETVTQDEFDVTEPQASYDYWMTSKDGKRWEFYYGD